MAPRLMVVCLGGLAGAGALVCCNMDEDPEDLAAAPEDGADLPIEVEADVSAESQAVPLH